MLFDVLICLAIINVVILLMSLCEKWLEHLGIFPEDYED